MTELTFTTATGAELAYQALDAALAHREAFDMSSWAYDPRLDAVGLDDLVAEDSCGTTACLAGWAVALRGLRVTGGGLVFTRDGRHVGEIWDVAVGLLEIDDEAGNDLFHCEDDEIETAVAETFGPRPELGS